MTDYLEEYLRDEAPLIDDDHRNLQRNALKEMLRLTAEAVGPALTQIESTYHDARQQAQAGYNNDRKKFELRREIQEETARRQYQERIEKIQTEYESDLGALEADAKGKSDRVISNAESREQDAQKNYEYEVMLAENVAEAALKRCRQDRQDIEEAVPAAKNRLDTLREHAETALQRYRQPLPPCQEAPVSDVGQTDDVIATFRQQHELARKYLDALYDLKIPRLFIGFWPYFFILLLGGAAVGLMWLLHQTLNNLPSFLVTGPMAFLAALIITLLTGRILWKKARLQINEVYEPFRRVVAQAHQLLDKSLKRTLEQLDQQKQQAAETRLADTDKTRQQFDDAKNNISRRRETLRQQIEQEQKQARSQLDQRRARDRRQADEDYQNLLPQLQQEHDQALGAIEQKLKQESDQCQKQYDAARQLLEERWRRGLACINALLEDTAQLDQEVLTDWRDPLWGQWTPGNTFASIVRFGSFSLNFGELADSVIKLAPFQAEPDRPVQLPALLTFPDRCSLLLQTQRQGREQAIETLRAVMMRLFTSMPPGRVQFTIVDPIGLGENFAGFMHAADYKEALIGGRIWTDTAQIQQQLDDLTHHMENVIQKYLRNEFETIEQYNLQAGELAEPYRFLVIADFPANFNEETARRLCSIINSGARCGVYTLIMYDARQELPPGFDVEDLTAKSIHLVNENGRFVWQDKIFRRFPLALDAPPAEEVITNIMHIVGRAGKEAARVEVPFDIIAPPDRQYWTEDSHKEIRVPIGRTGATRLQYLRLGHGVAQHMLIAGKTGSGKSTLLHVVITNLSLWYSPDQIELYLIDFKKGVEFKTYVTHKLAHARTVAIESDREFGLSVLQRVNAEMTHRGDLFRQAQVQDIASYRQAAGAVLPRTVLIVDEFQVFFSEDDKLAQDAALILEQLVRQGRAFGIHVILGSQSLGGTANLARSTIGQMAVRIALQCSETDAQLILDDDNVAARLLSRPGEAIYNDAGGMVVGNSPYQTAWLPDFCRDEYLTRVTALTAERNAPAQPMIVFEGNVPADIADNQLLAASLERSGPPASAAAPYVWLGEPVAIKEPTAAIFRRQSGANLLIIGQREWAALGLMNAAMISIAAQHRPQTARFVILDGSPVDSSTCGQLQRVASVLPHDYQIVPWREVPEVIGDLTAQIQQRYQNHNLNAPAIYLLVYGLQRYRMLRRSESDFSFSVDQESIPQPDKQFAEILREGPPVGIHTVVWADTLIAVERALERQTIREFDNRVLFQMSAADSSNLIDSPAANKLGFHRALFYSDEQGILEKFRPYAPVETQGLEQLRLRLKNQSTQDNPIK